MRFLALFLALIPIHQVEAQKIKIEENTASVDGETFIYYERRNMANEASVHGPNTDREEIYITYRNYTDPNQISNSNPEGKVRWVEINFLTLNQTCEVQSNVHKVIVKMLYENGIYENGVFNPEKAQRMVQKYGNHFSENRPGNIHIHVHD